MSAIFGPRITKSRVVKGLFSVGITYMLIRSVYSIKYPRNYHTASTYFGPPDNFFKLFMPQQYTQQMTPSFKVKSSNISFLKTPTEFKETLLESISIAEARIVLSSLYLGIGPVEEMIVSRLKAAGDRNVNVHLVFDGYRGTRGLKNSVTMIQPLLSANNTGVHPTLALYFNDKIIYLVNKLLPNKIKEVFGVHHIKLYIFDNTVIISGANLSDQYFENRQDRYVVIKNEPQLVNFFADFIRLYSNEVCYSIYHQEDISLLSDRKYIQKDANISRLNAVFTRFLSEQKAKLDISMENNLLETEMAIIYPSFQLPPFKIRHDSDLVLNLLTNMPSNKSMSMSSGYLNIPTELTLAVANLTNPITIITAAPSANSFYSPNPSIASPIGFIPRIYHYLAMKCTLAMSSNNKQFVYKEYNRPKWTFHAKGIWITDDKESSPEFTLIGSPNYGYRWMQRDLDMQIGIHTTNSELMNKMKADKDLVFDKKTSQDIIPSNHSPNDRQLPFYIRPFIFLIKPYL